MFLHLYFSVGCKVKMIIILIERAWETVRRQNIIIQTGNCQVVPILVGSSSDHREWSGPQFKVSAQVCIKHFYIKSINMYVLNIIFLRYLKCGGSVSSMSIGLPIFSRHRDRKLSQGYNSISLNQHLFASSSKACLIHLEFVVKEYTL